MTMNERDVYLASIEAAVGGAYTMGDGRNFWMDGPVARGVARRAAEGVGAWVRRHEPESLLGVHGQLATARNHFVKLERELADERAAHERTKGRVAALECALAWCSAAPSFLPGGEAREGWLRGCKPLLDGIAAPPNTSAAATEPSDG